MVPKGNNSSGQHVRLAESHTINGNLVDAVHLEGDTCFSRKHSKRLMSMSC